MSYFPNTYGGQFGSYNVPFDSSSDEEDDSPHIASPLFHTPQPRPFVQSPEQKFIDTFPKQITEHTQLILTETGQKIAGFVKRDDSEVWSFCHLKADPFLGNWNAHYVDFVQESGKIEDFNKAVKIEDIAFLKFAEFCEIFPAFPADFKLDLFEVSSQKVTPPEPIPKPAPLPQPIPEPGKTHSFIDPIFTSFSETQPPSPGEGRSRILILMDYIPVVATIKAIAHFVLKLLSPILPERLKEKRLITQLLAENSWRSLLFIALPIISSPIALFYDF